MTSPAAHVQDPGFGTCAKLLFDHSPEPPVMTQPTPFFALACATLVLASAGCAVSRDQESVGAYIDDTAITAAVKARFIDNSQVDANAISVETLKGTVMLSGFAKNSSERAAAETLAWKVKGVKQVNNEVSVRP